MLDTEQIATEVSLGFELQSSRADTISAQGISPSNKLNIIGSTSIK